MEEIRFGNTPSTLIKSMTLIWTDQYGGVWYELERSYQSIRAAPVVKNTVSENNCGYPSIPIFMSDGTSESSYPRCQDEQRMVTTMYLQKEGTTCLDNVPCDGMVIFLFFLHVCLYFIIII